MAIDFTPTSSQSVTKLIDAGIRLCQMRGQDPEEMIYGTTPASYLAAWELDRWLHMQEQFIAACHAAGIKLPDVPGS